CAKRGAQATSFAYW
nr:immunoglobulin heavy chain junction region [Mus musculus]